MGIVVTTKDANPIDLTASLIKAKYKMKNNKSCSVEWVVETSTSPDNYYELQHIASLFKEFDITVKRQEDIPELNPNKAKLISLLKDILKYIDVSEGMVRIQHGAIVLVRDMTSVFCRYFGWRHGKLLLCDNKKNPTFYEVDENDSQELIFQGSMNLCLIHNYGEFAHLPWYCIDSSIFPFEVEEIITPPEGCSDIRFNAEKPRLFPSGYSTYDYSSENDSALSGIEKWLYENGSVISSRQTGGTRCAKNLLLKIAGNVKNSIKDEGFYAVLHSLNNEADSSEKIIMMLIKIWALSQTMISFDRGFFNEIRNTGLINDDDELKMDRNDILNMLIIVMKNCLETVSLSDKTSVDLILEKEKPFGLLANLALKKSVQCFNQLFYEFYYINKATLPNLIKRHSNDKIDTRFWDVLLKKRTSNVMHVVRGSIFEFEAFKSINSKLAKSR